MGMVHVDPAGLATEADLGRWVDRAVRVATGPAHNR
jgi:hypothetical protein